MDRITRQPRVDLRGQCKCCIDRLVGCHAETTHNTEGRAAAERARLQASTHCTRGLEAVICEYIDPTVVIVLTRANTLVPSSRHRHVGRRDLSSDHWHNSERARSSRRISDERASGSDHSTHERPTSGTATAIAARTTERLEKLARECQKHPVR